MCDRLLLEGHTVTGLDNLLTGSMENLSHLDASPAFQFIHQDVNLPLNGATVTDPVDAVLHIASAASPKDYPAAFNHFGGAETGTGRMPPIPNSPKHRRIDAL